MKIRQADPFWEVLVKNLLIYKEVGDGEEKDQTSGSGTEQAAESSQQTRADPDNFSKRLISGTDPGRAGKAA